MLTKAFTVALSLFAAERSGGICAQRSIQMVQGSGVLGGRLAVGRATGGAG